MIRKSLKRGQRATKRLDTTDWAAIVRKYAPRPSVVLARVIVPGGESAHYELVSEGGALVDILVEVETVPDQVHLTCSLSGGWGGWWIPSVGDEVLVLLPASQLEFRPTIVATAPAAIPNPSGQGPAVNRRVFVVPAGGELLIHDGSGGAVSLAKESEAQGIKDAATAATDFSDFQTRIGLVSINGTSVLKAK